ncbi:hypothetical protein G6L37_05285 [Agrobacterium rubi]|nr:hypothetical protein [Agrobacterium rubi]NTF24770.1 hypothetical protein [Agrobacterium rubi]
MQKMLHGTSSEKAALIVREGFLPTSYFTTSVDDAMFYATTGGEEDLQAREEQWEEDNGYPPREEYGSDTLSMMQDLYPDGQHPVIIEVLIPDELVARATIDTGAEGALCFSQRLPSDIVTRVIEIDWEKACLGSYNPLNGAAVPTV